jgi:hypothetical protein
MRFYNIDMKGKFFSQRGGTNPPGTGPMDEGRIFYNESSEEMYYHDAADWIKVYSENNISDIVVDLDSSFLRKDQNDSTPFTIDAGNLTVSSNQVWHSGNDGSGSGLDADLLDGNQASYYYNASNLFTGTVPYGRLEGTYGISITGTARYG